MNYFWEKMSSKLGVYNAKELREKLWLSMDEFKRLMDYESARYRKYIEGKHGKEYYEAKVSENPDVAKYGGTPTFPPHPAKTGDRGGKPIFNDESGVFLEKKWSRSNKYNAGTSLPFDFIFKP